MKNSLFIVGALLTVLFFGLIMFLDAGKRSEQIESLTAQNETNIPIIPDVPRDAIPPLDFPKYVSVGESNWLDNNDIVLGVEIDGDIRAYPIKIMNWHEIVNEIIGGREVAVTYCPLCDSGIVFDRHVDGEIISFGNTGSLYESSMVMYDRETGSDWWQAGARALSGEFSGKELTILPSFMSRWEDWKRAYPSSLVLSLETGHSRPYSNDSFAGYDRPNSEPGFPVSVKNNQLPFKERIVGIVVNGNAKAYPVKLAKGTTLSDNFEGKDIEIVGDSGGRTAEVFFIDEMGARVRAPIVSEFWFSWFLSHPETEVFVVK